MNIKETSKRKTLGLKKEYRVTDSKPKRIGFFAAILVVIGSCVGTGIFFKAGTIMSNVNYSILLSLGCWIIAGFAVIAMGIALIDVAAQGKQDSLGIVSWTHTFNNLFFYKVNKNFYSFIFIPVKFFVVPVYICQSFQSGLSYVGATIDPVNHVLILSDFGKHVMDMPWWSILIIVTIINTFFIVVSGLSVNAGNKINMSIMYVKFIPIAFAFLIGFIVLGLNKGDLNPAYLTPKDDPTKSTWLYHPDNMNNRFGVTAPKPFTLLNPFIGVVMSMSAIFYAYDGFYVAVGIQGQLKQPKKISLVILFGLITVTVLYLAISLSIILGAYKGDWTKVGLFFVAKKCAWVYVLMSLLISVGILTEVNAYAMWFSLFFQTLIRNREVPGAKHLAKWNNLRKPVAGMIYLLIVVTFFTTVLTIVGALGYQVGPLAASNAGFSNYKGAYLKTAYLYMFIDLISNWQTVITFMFLCITILGWFRKKTLDKQNPKLKSDYVKMVSAIISCTITVFAMCFQFMEPIANLIINVQWNHLHPDHYESLVSQICLIVILVVIIAMSFIPAIFEAKNEKNKEIYRLEIQLHDKKLALQDLLAKKQDLAEQAQQEFVEFEQGAKMLGDVPVSAEVNVLPIDSNID
ncbi:APC family permease [Ureaplasma ceti]|uniref:APC family permease n=1 Tax=Ureaplasma ceti TaxID=3119530 RepID=A0ABP9U6G6_9BACT